MKKATDVGLQTWEADVYCGVWCQGGSVRWLKTDHPQYTDASDVWVRGDDAIAALESLRAENARMRAALTRLRDENKAARLLSQAADALERAPRWRDVSDELPAEAQEVLFVRGGKTVHGAWIGGIFWHSGQKMAAAKWMPLPAAPVQEERK